MLNFPIQTTEVLALIKLYLFNRYIYVKTLPILRAISTHNINIELLACKVKPRQ